MKILHIVSFILLIVGGLNWGLVGFFNFDLVTAIFGDGSIARVIYALVGIAAIVEIFSHKKTCTACKANGAAM